MTNATFASGYTFSIDGTTVKGMMDSGIPLPSPVADEIDKTTQDSGIYYETFLGRVKGGTVTFQGLYDSTDNGQTALITAYGTDAASLGSIASHAFIVTLPSGSTWSFNGYVKSATNPVIDKKVGLKADITITGGATFAGTTTNLTTPFFAVSGAGTLLVPVASATPGTYVVNIANSISSVTITPTCATAGTTITVNATVVATGVASGAITLGAAGTIKTAQIVVTKSGQAPGIYNLILTKAT
jgi:hypothetical protein